MNVIEWQTLKITPDIVHEYNIRLKKNRVPLIIDNGSYECRVGWATNDKPLMMFRNLIAKPRKEKAKKDGEPPLIQPTQIGNDIVNIEAMRYQLRTQFDRNVVTHFHNQEQMFDDIFRHLSIDTENCVNHPIVLTECVANPNHSRQLMSELLFECYDVPSIAYGIDSLFSFSHGKASDTGLIVSFGYHSIHIIPVIRGKAQYTQIRRISIGGFHIINFLHRMLQLKYPIHVNAITISRVEWLLHNHCSVAYDYLAELRQWAKLDYYEQNVQKIQLPYAIPVNSNTSILTAEQKNEKKRELAKRLVEMNARKREERLANDRQQLQKLKDIKQHFERGEIKDFHKQLKKKGLSNRDELEKTISTIQNRIDRAYIKQNQPEQSSSNNQIEEKMAQVPANYDSMDSWISDVRQKRIAMLEKRNARKQRKQDLAKRRTVAAQERMRIISQLARKDKDDDDFGMRDEDWDVYKAISKDGDSDSDAENEKLIEYETILRHNDPTFDDPQNATTNIVDANQLHLGVESIRAPEILFQPNMIGVPEAGVIETIDFVLKQFTAEDQLSLTKNIFLTGGCSNFKGLKERINREMTQIRPYQTVFKIIQTSNTHVDAWQGARNFANSPKFKSSATTKADYMEHGSEYFKEHYASNRYFPTPAPIVTVEQINMQTDDNTAMSNNDSNQAKLDENVLMQ